MPTHTSRNPQSFVPDKSQSPHTIADIYCMFRIYLISEVAQLEPQLYLAKLMDVTNIAQVPPEQNLVCYSSSDAGY